MVEKKDIRKFDRSAKNSARDSDMDFVNDTEKIDISSPDNVLAEMEATLNGIARENPRITSADESGNKAIDDLRAVLQVSLAVNSSLVLEDILRVVMKKSIELLNAERGFIMLLDRNGELQFKTAHNIGSDALDEEDFKISYSIANEVASTGNPVYTSDALSDARFANQQSILELHLRSIMCVPLKIKSEVLGLIYLDNSSQAKLFLKSDLYLFELFAAQAAQAIHNATLYDQLLDMKEFNEKVVDNSPVGVIVIDSKQNLVSINDAALEVLDRNKEGIRHLTAGESPSKFSALVPEAELSKWDRMINSALKNNKPFDDPRYFHNTRYSEKVLSIKISPISKIPTDGDGLILVIEDITEKVIMEKYVILSEKLVARGEMAASIGHELNNYLAIIANNAELLAYNLDKGDTDRLKFNAQQITETISKVKRFTEGLMDFSKLETEIISYDAKRLIEELLFSLRAQKRFKNIELNVDIEENLPEMEIDVGQIQQVLLNLLINAADALEERLKRETDEEIEKFPPQIDLTVYKDVNDGMIKIVVKDNGIGITPENLPKIFQLHFTTKDSGHGLGLANCKKIVTNHKGDISLISTPGKGTTFTISLPEKQLESVG